MAYILVRLNALLPEQSMENILNKQLDYMAGEAEQYPAGFSAFLGAVGFFRTSGSDHCGSKRGRLERPSIFASF